MMTLPPPRGAGEIDASLPRQESALASRSCGARAHGFEPRATYILR